MPKRDGPGPHPEVRTVLSAKLRLPDRSVLLTIDSVAELIAGQLAPPEGNGVVHRRLALLAASPSLAKREAAANGLDGPQRQQSLEALARELDELSDVEAGFDVNAEVERRLRSENIGTWTWRVFDALKGGTLLGRLRDGVRVSWPTSAGKRAPGWVSAGDLGEWLTREGYDVTHEEAEAAARADGMRDAAERAEPERAATVHRTTRRRQGDALSVLIELAAKTAVEPTEPSSVWAQFKEMARRSDRPAPLLGVDEEGIKYADERADDGIGHLTSTQFRDRWRKSRKK
jgi:hypothetical protein